MAAGSKIIFLRFFSPPYKDYGLGKLIPKGPDSSTKIEHFTLLKSYTYGTIVWYPQRREY